MKDIATYIALNRFGLGTRPGDDELVDGDPRGWIKSQINNNTILPRSFVRFRSSEEINAAIHSARLEGAEQRRRAIKEAYKQDFVPEVFVRARHMIATDTPFAERMVLFWSNHFTVSNSKRIVGPTIPAYEREVIRPHLFGSFADMLKTVCRHPTMLAYLDNMASAGENSRAGKRRKNRGKTTKTLNENLSREILELHTLGVNGGYSQTDVIELAKAISGWSHGGFRFRAERQPLHGGFEFKPHFHEPGPKTVLGKSYPEDGEYEGLEILDDLARHPSTARFVATKLVRHFVADQPPADAVDAIARVFRETDGDLAAVSEALVDLPQVWAEPVPKIKTHYEFVISTHRALGNDRPRRRDLV